MVPLAELIMPPVNSPALATLMPLPDAVIAPLLLMPPVKVEGPLTTMPDALTDSVPELLMPPLNIAPPIEMAGVATADHAGRVERNAAIDDAGAKD